MISRRHLLAALAAIPALPVRVFGQDAPGRGQPRDQPGDTTPLVPPFELKKRDAVYVNREGQREPRPDMTGTLESFHVPDAMGWDLQIGNKIAPSR